MVYHFYWQLGEYIDPLWEQGEAMYRVRPHGDPPLECHLMGQSDADGRRPVLGAVDRAGRLHCGAAGVRCGAGRGDEFRLEVVKPRGLVGR